MSSAGTLSVMGIPLVEMQAYAFTLFFGLTVPLLVYWLLRSSLRHFLSAVFQNPGIELFWKRVVLLVFILSSFAVGVGYTPDSSITGDMAALVWSVADQMQFMLQALMWSIFGLFLPLLLSYTILHVGRSRPPVAKGPEQVE